MTIVDAHLDLAYNVARGRDPRRPAAEQPVIENEIATVGLPDLRAGGVGLVCATIFCSPVAYRPNGYRDAEGARQQALAQLATYRHWVAEGLVRLVRHGEDIAIDLTTHKSDQGDRPTDALLLLEGADALRSTDDVAEWFDAGLRVVGLAWRRTRSAGGTGEPGGLTAFGRELVREIDRVGIIHDLSHLAEQAFWELLELSEKPVIATHSNCRAIVPGDRQLSDAMIKAIADRGGVIGINFYEKFLLPPEEAGKRRANLTDVVAHIRHVCDLTGSASHVGLGTDMDGGLGREQIPIEIATSTDLPRVAEALSSDGFGDEAVRRILGENWRRFFRSALA